MRKMQPFYYIVLIAALMILVGITNYIFQVSANVSSSGVIVDPPSQDQENLLYDLWFTRTDIYDLSIDQEFNHILFSTSANKAYLLDSERKLHWEKSFSTSPRQAKLSSCGNYAVIGTRGGRLLFTSVDQNYRWEKEGNPVNLITVSPNATWIAATRAQEDSTAHTLELYNFEGELIWEAGYGPIKTLHLSSEYLEQGKIYLTCEEEDLPVLIALDLSGIEHWRKEGYTVSTVSRYGSRLAARKENELVVYDALGYKLWQTTLPFEIDQVFFNPQNYNRILVYGSREGAGGNLYYFDFAEGLLWTKLIIDSSLVSFTVDGQNIITSSWRHFKEDYTKMFYINLKGEVVVSWEVAMRVERLLIPAKPYTVLVCGEDGYLDLINIEPLLTIANTNELTQPVYKPASTTIRSDVDRIKLYFADSRSNLIPVTRSVSITDNRIRTALNELIRGPARNSFLFRTIPDQNAVMEVRFDQEEGSLYIELSEEFSSLGGAIQSETALNSIILTLSPFREIKNVFFTMNGELIDTFGDELPIEQPLQLHQWAEPIYAPVQAGDRFYLTVTEADQQGEGGLDLQFIMEKALRLCRALPEMPPGLRLINVDYDAELVRINLNREFKDLFPADGSEADKQIAAILLDSLFLTAFTNSNTLRVELLVEGQKWTPPHGYPALIRYTRKPFYINPE